MTLAQVLAEKVGGQVDRWGNVRYEKNDKVCRLAIRDRVVRHEVQKVSEVFGQKECSWIRIKSYKKKELMKKFGVN